MENEKYDKMDNQERDEKIIETFKNLLITFNLSSNNSYYLSFN